MTGKYNRTLYHETSVKAMMTRMKNFIHNMPERKVRHAEMAIASMSLMIEDTEWLKDFNRRLQKGLKERKRLREIKVKRR